MSSQIQDAYKQTSKFNSSFIKDNKETKIDSARLAGSFISKVGKRIIQASNNSPYINYTENQESLRDSPDFAL